LPADVEAEQLANDHRDSHFFSSLILLVFSAFAVVSRACFLPPSCNHKDVGEFLSLLCARCGAKCIFTKRSHYILENNGAHKTTNPFALLTGVFFETKPIYFGTSVSRTRLEGAVRE
jgi:hypothetical protein